MYENKRPSNQEVGGSNPSRGFMTSKKKTSSTNTDWVQKGVLFVNVFLVLANIWMASSISSQVTQNQELLNFTKNQYEHVNIDFSSSLMMQVFSAKEISYEIGTGFPEKYVGEDGKIPIPLNISIYNLGQGSLKVEKISSSGSCDGEPIYSAQIPPGMDSLIRPYDFRIYSTVLDINFSSVPKQRQQGLSTCKIKVVINFDSSKKEEELKIYFG